MVQAGRDVIVFAFGKDLAIDLVGRSLADFSPSNIGPNPSVLTLAPPVTHPAPPIVTTEPALPAAVIPTGLGDHACGQRQHGRRQSLRSDREPGGFLPEAERHELVRHSS